MLKKMLVLAVLGGKLIAMAIALQPKATADDCPTCPIPPCFPLDCTS